MSRTPTFEEAMESLRKKEERRERLERDKPRKYFYATAIKAGFTTAQAKFLWNNVAKKGHEHWDGRIG